MDDVMDEVLVFLLSRKNMSPRMNIYWIYELKRKHMKRNRNLQEMNQLEMTWNECMSSYTTFDLMSIYWSLILLSMRCCKILLHRS